MFELFNKKNNNDKYKYFVVIALGWMGDTLMAEGLCKNIKLYNPDANITFIVLKNFSDIPKLIPDVDEIVIYDKKGEHKGVFAFLKFAQLFKNKKVDVAVVVHPHERSILCARAIGAKYILSVPLKGKYNPLNLLINKKKEIIIEETINTYKNNYNATLLNLLGIKIEKTYPVFRLLENDSVDFKRFNLPIEYLVLVPESKNDFRSWNYKCVLEFIKSCDIPIVLTGTEKTLYLSDKLKKDGAEFIDLSGKTSIIELAHVIKNSMATISVDTGSMHLAYGLGVHTICLFYVVEKIKKWLPQELSNVHLLLGKKIISEGKIITSKEITHRQVLDVVDKILIKN